MLPPRKLTQPAHLKHHDRYQPASNPMSQTPLDSLPEPIITSRRRVAWVWLVPTIAVLIGVVLLVQYLMGLGPTIVIEFETAEGLKADQTELRFKDVVVGRVTGIELSEDRSHIKAEVSLIPAAAALAVEDSRFWVVRPRADLGGVSGLDTLLTGAYIAVDVGVSEKPAREFIGQDQPPRVLNNQEGRRLTLRADALNSLNIGSPIYFRGIVVGRIVGFDLDPSGDGVTLQGFVEAPYHENLRATSRFWNVSGVDVSLDAGGLRVNTASILTLIGGGVAFYNPDGGISTLPREPMDLNVAAEIDALAFALFENEVEARAKADPIVLDTVMRFAGSMRGLTVGAPIDFFGVEVGRVTETELEYDVERKGFVAATRAELYPARLGRAFTQWQEWQTGLGETFSSPAEAGDRLIRRLIDRGLRAQLRTGNLITGQLYVALDMLAPAAQQAAEDSEHLEIPSVAGSFDQIQIQISNIVSKLDALPLGDMAGDLAGTLESLNKLMGTLEGEVSVELTKTLEQVQTLVEGLSSQVAAPNAPLQQDLQQMMEQIDRAAHSLRSLTDSLQRNPQSLLRGRPEADE
jgi:paraquat-inducible protein B